VREFREALRRHTCLNFLEASAGPPPGTADILRWLPLIGGIVGLVVASLHLPLAEFLLPLEVAIVAALCLQAFLLNFGPERALWSTFATGGPERAGTATALLVLSMLAKFTIYRQFLGPELGRLLLLGTVSSLSAPYLVAARMPRHQIPDGCIPPPHPSAQIPVWILWAGLAAFVVGSAGVAPAQIFRGTVCVAACMLLAQMVLAAWLRERHGGMPHGSALAASLPSEVAACAGLLIARSQFL